MKLKGPYIGMGATAVDGYQIIYNTWSSDTNYVIGNKVLYSGNNYICIQNNLSDTTTPNLIPLFWTLI
jgi:hypothetical protein